MNALLAVCRIIDEISRRFGQIATWLVLISAVVSAGNAFSRYSMSLTSNAWLEIQWYMFAAMFMLGASHTLAKNEHVRVDIIFGHLPTRVQIWVDILGGFLFLLPAVIILTWLSWPTFFDSFVSHEMSGNPGGLIRWPVKIFLPLGFGLLIVQGVSEIIKRIAMLTGHLKADAHYERPLQ